MRQPQPLVFMLASTDALQKYARPRFQLSRSRRFSPLLADCRRCRRGRSGGRQQEEREMIRCWVLTGTA